MYWRDNKAAGPQQDWLELLFRHGSWLDSDTRLLMENDGVYLGNGSFLLAAFTLPEPAGHTGTDLLETLQTRRAALASCAAQGFRGVCLNHVTDFGWRVLALLCLPKIGPGLEERARAQERMRPVLSEILAHFYRETGVEAHAVLSDLYEDLPGIEKAFQEAEDMCAFLAFLSAPPPFLVQKTMTPADMSWEENVLFRSLNFSLVEAVQAGDERQIEKNLEQFFSYSLSVPPFGLSYLNMRVTIFLYHLMELLVEHAMLHSGFLENLNPVYGLTRCADEAEFREKLRDYLYRVLACFQEKAVDNRLRRMEEICRYVAENIRDCNLTVGGIADHFGLQRSTLSNQFKAYKDCALSDHILRLRADLARQEILEGRTTLEEVAAHAGFGSYLTMHRAFKKLYGISPGQLRMEKNVI